MAIELFPKDKIVVYVDGGSWGNPGPAAIGLVIGNREYAEKIGQTTNNVAEYKAIIFSLKKVKQLLGSQHTKEIEIKIACDSELVTHQLNGQYKIKDEELKDLFIEVWNLKQDFKKVEFILVPREENKTADRLVNQALDAK